MFDAGDRSVHPRPESDSEEESGPLAAAQAAATLAYEEQPASSLFIPGATKAQIVVAVLWFVPVAVRHA